MGGIAVSEESHIDKQPNDAQEPELMKELLTTTSY